MAREAVARGAAIINDISGLQYDPASAAVAAETGAALILMHTRGRSQTMYELAVYDDVVAEVSARAGDGDRAGDQRGRVRATRSSSIPGFGFAKRAEHSYELWRSSTSLRALDRPILPASRKSFLKAALGERTPGRARVGHRGGRHRQRAPAARTSFASTASRRWSMSCASRTGSATTRVRVTSRPALIRSSLAVFAASI